MSFLEALENRRSVYALNRELPVSEDEAISTIKRAIELAPDAFNMHSTSAVIVTGEKQDELWDAAFDAFGGQVAREKIDGFKGAYGTVLFFIDETKVKGLQEQFALYADNFPIWAQQANGMAQLAVWTALREAGIGANLQHYNPVINEAVAKLTGHDSNWTLIAQMPFGGIAAPAGDKDAEVIEDRVKVVK